jgi:tRNA(Ile)-lysidine synthase
MPHPQIMVDIKALSSHSAVRRATWACRELVALHPGGPTLVACSGGADSIAMVLVMVRAKLPIIVAHVVHDLRSVGHSLGDRDAVVELSRVLGVRWIERAVAVRRGNTEANLEAAARRLRQSALMEMSREVGATRVFTGHHGDDQLETMLMAFSRGAGPRGLSGMPVQRALQRASVGAPTLWLMRPFLHPIAAITRADTESICSAACVPWRHDHTNDDRSRTRAAIRHRLLPLLRELRPGLAERACRSSVLLREADKSLQGRVRRVIRLAERTSVGLAWQRPSLQALSPAVLGEVLRTAANGLVGSRGADGRSGRRLAPIIRSILRDATDPKTHRLGELDVRVDAHRVELVVRAR